jgi:hypothetical protein
MQGRFFSTGFSVALVVAMLSFAFADEPRKSDANSLIGSIERLAERPPDAKQSLEAARKRLLSSVEALEQILARGKSEAATRWSRWLDLPTLHEQLAAEQPDLAAIKAIEERLCQNCAGLELPAFVAVRRDLDAFRTASEYASAKSPQTLYRQRVMELAECLKRMADGLTYADGHQAGQSLAWLEALDENGASLVVDVRKKLCHTNGFAQASARLANVLFQRNVSERNYIAETVLGSYMRGVAITHGQLALGLAPSDDHGTLEILLRGHVSYPANVADRRRISVYSSGYTTIDAKKEILVDDQGLRLSRAAAQAATNVNIQDIDAPRLMERISWRRASRLTPEAEAMTSRRAESEAASSLDQQADASLGMINNTFCEKIRAPLIRFNALPAEIHVWTDPTHLHLSLCQHNQFQLAATGPAPTLPSSYDIGGSVHESMINNLAEPTLGGKSIDDKTWLEMMHLILGAPPRALWVHDRAERWSVTFAKELPIVTRFDGDRIGITLHLSGVTRGGNFIQKAVEIEASFIPKITKEGPALSRVGELLVRVHDAAELDSDSSLHDFLMRKFGAILPSEIYFYGFTPPAGGALGKLQLLKPVAFRSWSGWLTLAYELQGSINPATLPIAQSALRPSGVQ